MIDIGDLHFITGKSARLVETYGFESTTFDCLFGLGACHIAFSQSHQAEAIGKIEQNRIRCRETIGDKIAKSQYFHDAIDIKLEHPRQRDQVDSHAHNEHFDLEYN